MLIIALVQLMSSVEMLNKLFMFIIYFLTSILLREGYTPKYKGPAIESRTKVETELGCKISKKHISLYY